MLLIQMEFMSQKENYRVNFNSKFGTALVLPYMVSKIIIIIKITILK